MAVGFWQVIVIGALVLLLFGAGRIPRVMEDLAKGIKSFKSGLKEDDLGMDKTDKVLDAQSDKR